MNNMNKTLRGILDVVWYVVVFFLLQFFFTLFVAAVGMWTKGDSAGDVLQAFQQHRFGLSSSMAIASTVLSSVATLCLFVKFRWAPVSRAWLRGKPWGVLFWAVFLALGTILPSEWLVEQLEFTMPEATEKLFEDIMGKPLGYLSIGIFAPLAEELVFRGAVLRTLLDMTARRWHWVAIAVSAAIFGAVHGNAPQFVHAFLIGLLLGWMYYRTGSILPGVMFHWVNNTVAYVMFNIMPQMADGKLIDLFHGDTRMMWLGLLFSLCIVVPSVFQLALRMRHADKEAK